MAGKATFLVGFGAGYLMGARAGRERYDQIMQKVQQLWRDPRVQDKAHQAEHLMQAKAQQAGQRVKEKAGAAASSVWSGESSSSAVNGTPSTYGAGVSGTAVEETASPTSTTG